MTSSGKFRFPATLAFIALVGISTDLHAQPAGGKWVFASQLPLLTNPRMVFADSLIGYYIGADTGYVTKNGGLTWTMMNFPANARPSPTFLFTPDKNTVVSYQRYSTDINGDSYPGIIKSTDMGSTWSLVSSSVIPGNVHALTMWTANDGFRIWKDDITLTEACAVTHDAGVTFSDIRGDATLEKHLTQIGKGAESIKSDWSDSLHGAVSVSGTVPTKAYPILLTSDGGRTWSEQYLKFKGDSTIKLGYTYFYPGTGSIWVVPSDPKVGQFYYYSADYGKNWVTSDTLKAGYISKLAPVSPNSPWAFIVGSLNFVSGTSNYLAYKDQSSNWKFTDTLRASKGFGGASYVIQDIQFNDAGHGWVRAIKEKIVNSEPIVTDTAYFFKFSATTPSSVARVSEMTSLRCMPNPAFSTINIAGFSQEEIVGDVMLSNTLGRQYPSPVYKGSNGIELDISKLPNGCYFARITSSLRKEIISVIVIH